MMRRRAHSLRISIPFVAALVAMSALPSSLAFAAEGKRVAFVVGIGKYDNLASEKQLKNAVNDAEGVSAKLAEKKIGFQVTMAPDLTRSAFSEKWQNVLNRLTKDDTFVLYFSGHGIQISGQNYLLPRDIPFIEYGRDEQLKREAISLNELLADLSSGDRPHPKRSIVILDACRDNPLIPPGYKSASIQRGLAGLPDSDGIFVIYAAASNRTALDRLSPSDKAKYSVFTRTLLPLIERKDLSIQELSSELKDQVINLTKSVGREQRPTYYDGLSGRFCLPGCTHNADKRLEPRKEKVMGPIYPELHDEITGKDDAEMVLITGGEFAMGSKLEEIKWLSTGCTNTEQQQSCRELYESEYPQHQVWGDAFYLDKYEVTNRLFREFIKQTGYRTTAEQKGSSFAFIDDYEGIKLIGWKDLSGAYWERPNAGKSVFDLNRGYHPVVSVSWDDAIAYCRWAGKRLPSEAEWEYAARGKTPYRYWWGDDNPGSRRVENIADESVKFFFKEWIMPGYQDGAHYDTAVGSYEANPWGVYDISGNVAEWTSDWYGPKYYGSSPKNNPKGPSTGTYRVVRGGSWSSAPVQVRSAARFMFPPSTRHAAIGFRCAQDAPK